MLEVDLIFVGISFGFGSTAIPINYVLDQPVNAGSVTIDVESTAIIAIGTTITTVTTTVNTVSDQSLPPPRAPNFVIIPTAPSKLFTNYYTSYSIMIQRPLGVFLFVLFDSGHLFRFYFGSF